MQKTKKEIEFWERDKAGNLIPQEVELHFHNEHIMDYINMYESNIKNLKEQLLRVQEDGKSILQLEIDKFTALVTKLREHYEDSKRTMTIGIIPMLPYELDMFFNKKAYYDQNKRIEDAESYICSMKCVNPLYTYEQWRDMKDVKFKKAVLKKILDNSVDDNNELADAKKLVRRLMESQSQGTSYSNNTDMTGSNNQDSLTTR